MLKKIFLSTFLLFLVSQLGAQVTFQTKVSKNRMGINERLKVSFEMNKNGDNFTPPKFEGFRVVGGPNQSTSNTWINGKRSFSRTYTYFLNPTRKGTLKIRQATIKIDGEIYKTSPVQVEVTDAVKTPNQGGNADYIADQNVHLVAEISNGRPYLNEAFTVVYKLYYTSQIGISNVNEVESPSYADFWSHLIPIQKLEMKQGVYKGETYNYVTWRKAVLYPQKTGELVIEPLTLNINVQVPSNRRDIFGQRINRQVPKVITAGKRTIKVKPLPEKNKPIGFTGAVGSFDLSYSLNKKVLKASESFQATLKVSGRGNLKLFGLPKITVPATLEVYEPEHAESIKTNLLGMQGNIQDTYTIVPEFQGNYPIPGVSFSYFDPNKESYVTLSSKEYMVNVNEGPLAGKSPKGQIVSNLLKPNLNDKQFNFIALETDLQPIIKSQSFFGKRNFYLMLFGPFVFLLLFTIWFKTKSTRKIDPETERQKTANRLVKKYLSSAKKALRKKEAFYESLERALHNYLKAKLRIVTSEFSKDRITSLLKGKKVEINLIKEFVALLSDCEAARYAPTTSVRMQEDFDRASKLISRMDKQL
ncbi:MAG: BatD family protein [Flavobacteriaceae bacterium]|nr:BatD family protein [Flavobacteriaceae bacterium]